jgi:amylosucrase
MPHLMSVAKDTVASCTPESQLHFLTALLHDVAPQRRSILHQRLTEELPTLRDRLSRLYGASPNFEHWLEQVITQVVHSARTRPQDLWQQDVARTLRPDWHQDAMLGYCAYVDKFAGTLRGVAQRIPHLRELGVTYLHLLPFLKAGTAPNDGGFAVASFEEIEPSLGTQQDLRDLTTRLRAAGISLCSDFVLNHVSHEHPWARQALAGDPAYQQYFHWMHSPEEVAGWERHLAQIFPHTAPGNFTYVPQRQAWAWTTFYPYQWDLNYANPAVFAEMLKALLHLANQGVEAFRLDSTGFLWKRAGTNCLNQPEVHWILQALRSLMTIAAPGVLLKAEAIMPTRDLPPYFGLGDPRGNECHLAYHSSLMAASWMALAEQNADIVRSVLANTPRLPPRSSWMTYVRCHDDIGWNVLRPELDEFPGDAKARLLQTSRFFAGELPHSYARGASFQTSDPLTVHGTNGMTAALVGLASAQAPQEQAQAVQRLILMYALSMFVGGLPLIYMGDEFALGNTSEVELARRQGPDGRELHRPPFDVQAFAMRYAADTPQGQVFQALCAMSRARRQSPALRATEPLQAFSTGHPAVLGLRRGRTCLGLFNFSEQTLTVNLGGLRRSVNALALQDLITPGHFHADALRLEPFAARWLEAQD